ncbi:MAG: FadR family transcriptional regulator [Burkholderiaceae bacterium]|nr:FadR family transcriptional regulator [Burkholderiaceae bacterium]
MEIELPVIPKTDPQPDAGASLIRRLIGFLRERTYEPGERLPSERVLAERFGVTRSQIREALVVLRALRLIERKGRSGVHVASDSERASVDATVMKVDLGVALDEDEINSLNEFRDVIESQALVMACKRRRPEDIDRMDACMRECRERLARGDSIAQPSADFHLAVVAAAGNQFLLRAANSFYLATREWREVVFDDPDVCRRSIVDHQAIRDAIVARSVTRARQAGAAHLSVAASYWREHAAPAVLGRRISGPRVPASSIRADGVASDPPSAPCKRRASRTQTGRAPSTKGDKR